MLGLLLGLKFGYKLGSELVILGLVLLLQLGLKLEVGTWLRPTVALLPVSGCCGAGPGIGSKLVACLEVGLGAKFVA